MNASNRIHFENPADLYKTLGNHHLDTTSWIKGPDRLYEEIQKGECTLEEEGSQLIRSVQTVFVKCVYKNEKGEVFELVEDKQEFKNGQTRARNNNFIAEKMEPEESPHEAAMRGLIEELQIKDPHVSATPNQTEVKREESKTYKGLTTEYKIHYFTVEITPEQYRETYIEEQPDKTTYFSWKKV